MWKVPFILLVFGPVLLLANTPEDLDFRQSVRVHIRQHCSSCHNSAESKGGVNLDVFDFAYNVARRGELFLKVIREIREESMPPSGQPRMTDAERDTMIAGIKRILDRALAVPDPGPAVMRRLSHREYTYTIKDLLGVDFQAGDYFPTDASGGEGFDNQGRVLYITPLLWERYYEASDSILRVLRKDEKLWRDVVPKAYRPSIFRRLVSTWKTRNDQPLELWPRVRLEAKNIIKPLAWRTYRRFLEPEEEADLLAFFEEVYQENWKKKEGFEDALQIVFKRMLISPNFLFRMESNVPVEQAYPVNNFELANRLSYLMWSSMPDDTLLEVAYRDDLHDSLVMRRQVLRMMASPKFKRFSGSFAPQWLGISELTNAHQTDLDLYPSFTSSLREALQAEVVEYFHYVFSEGDLTQLIHSDFSFLNEELAMHYGIEGVAGSELRPIQLPSGERGGVLGMGAVLASTSLPHRTSPVLRGQWVLENLLGRRVPPPPPDVPELEEASGSVRSETDLRSLLEFHREPSACKSCHQKMDPIGFGLENFDAIGRWRTYYEEEITIDATGILDDDTVFSGPYELKQILLEEKEDFAETFSRKLLSYSLGRGLLFLDTKTINRLKKQLILHNFKGEEVMVSLATSFTFRNRRSDVVDRYKDKVG